MASTVRTVIKLTIVSICLYGFLFPLRMFAIREISGRTEHKNTHSSGSGRIFQTGLHANENNDTVNLGLPNQSHCPNSSELQSQNEDDEPTQFDQNSNRTYHFCTYGVFWRRKVNDTFSENSFESFQESENHMFNGCPNSNCKFTTDHAKADVVVVESMALDWGIIKHPPLPRMEGQLWVLQTWEPPPIMHKLPWHRLERQFHLTATYQTTSDLFSPYGTYAEKPPNEIGKSDIFEILPNKTKLVAWFVSNCRGQSDRMRYVNELKKYIKVDIYGRCGNLTCIRGDSSCLPMLKYEYKFYLAFENSICFDYITEKPWLKLGTIIPVVLGGGDYKKYFPPHSVIDVRDFSSAKQLAEYLHKLDRNPALYAEYYNWTYRFKSWYWKKDTSWWCKVCDYINTHTITQKQLRNPKVSVRDLTNVTHSCIDPDTFYKKILYDNSTTAG